MELVFAFLLARFYFGKIVKVVGTLWIDTFMYNKVLAVFLVNQGMGAVRTFQGVLLVKTVFFWGKSGLAYFAKDLAFFAVVAVKVRHGSVAGRAVAVFGNVTFLASGNRL